MVVYSVPGPGHLVVNSVPGPGHLVVNSVPGPGHLVVNSVPGPGHLVVNSVPGPGHLVVNSVPGPGHLVVNSVPGPGHFQIIRNLLRNIYPHFRWRSESRVSNTVILPRVFPGGMLAAGIDSHIICTKIITIRPHSHRKTAHTSL